MPAHRSTDSPTSLRFPRPRRLRGTRTGPPEIVPIGLAVAEAALGRLQTASASEITCLVRQTRANLGWAADTLDSVDDATRAVFLRRIDAVEQALARRGY